MHEQTPIPSPTIQISYSGRHGRFCQRRHDALGAFHEWLLTDPQTAHVVAELRGMINALLLIAEVHQPGIVADVAFQ